MIDRLKFILFLKNVNFLLISKLNGSFFYSFDIELILVFFRTEVDWIRINLLLNL